MGLAEGRVKQKLALDPRNTTWSNDTSKFGFKMLEKMGWKPGKGLGVKEDGSLEHIKTSFNKDNRGIGADAKTGELWLENSTGFSQLLARLNNNVSSEEPIEAEDSTPKKKSKEDKKEKKKKAKVSKDEPEKEKKSKKSKRSKETETKDETMRLSKKSKKEKKSSKEDSEEGSPVKESAPAPIRLSHRARYIQNKRLSTMDPASLSAIFGVRS